MKQIKRWLAYALVFTMLVGSVPMEGLATEITVSGNEDIVLEEVEETVSDNSTVSGNETVSDNEESVEIGDAITGEDVSENEETVEITVSENEETNEENTDSTLAVTSTDYMDSGVLEHAGRSKGSIRYMYNKIMSLTTAELYSAVPSYKKPYSPGALTDKNQKNALAFLNYTRYAAGLKPTVLNSSLADQAQYGAVLLAAVDTLTHTPSRPSDMEETFYNRGYQSTASSNIGKGYTFLNDHIRGCLKDNSSASNLLCLGHRRWLLNPRLYNVGFGQAGAYTVTQVFDTSRTEEGDYDFIAWPASGNFPKDLFGSYMPWSVTLNPNKYQAPDISKVKVVLKSLDKGTTDTFTSANKSTNPISTTKYLEVNKEGYGVSNCIIFNTGAALVGDNYEVTISGIFKKDGTATTIKYKVNLFDVTSVQPSCVALSPASMNLTLGEGGCEIGSTQTINVTENALFEKTDQKITWSSNKTDVVSVSPNGTVGRDTHSATIKINGIGTATITAKNIEGNTATCVIKVYRINPNVKLQGEFRKIDDNGVEGFQVGERFFFELFQNGTYNTENPVKYDSDWFEFKSNDTGKAAIDSYGQVTMISPGKVTLTATLKNDPKGRKVSKTITVLKKQVAAMDFTWDKVELPDNQIECDYEIKADNGTITYRKGEKHQIGVKAFAVLGEKITDTGFEFSSTDTSVAKVSSKGEVTFTGPGVCNIKITAKDTHKYSESIKVILKEYSPRMDKTSISFNQAHKDGENNRMEVFQAYNTTLPGEIGLYDESELEGLGITITDSSGFFKISEYERTEEGAIFAFDTVEDTKKTKSGKVTIGLPVTMEDGSTDVYSFTVSVKANCSIPSSSVKAGSINLNLLNESGDDFLNKATLYITTPNQTDIEYVEFVPVNDLGDGVEYKPFEIESSYSEISIKGQKKTYLYEFGAKTDLLTYLRELNITNEKELISKINRDYKLLVYYEGYDMPYEKKIKVNAGAGVKEVSIAHKDGIFYQVPATLRNEVLLKDVQGNKVSIPMELVKVLVNNQDITVTDGVAEGSEFTIRGGEKLEIYANNTAGSSRKSHTFKITVASDRLLLPYTYTYKTSIKEEPTNVTSSTKKVTIYRDKEDTLQTITLSVKGQPDAVLSDLTSEVMYKKQILQDSPFEISYEGKEVNIDLVDGETIEAGTYKLTFTTVFEYMVDSQTKVTFDELKPISINVVVNATVPKAKLSKSTVALDKYFAADKQEVSLTKIEKLKEGYGNNYVPVDSISCTEVKFKGQKKYSSADSVQAVPLVSMNEKGEITVSFGDNISTELTTGDYRYRFEPSLVSDDGEHICKLPAVTLTVQVKDAIPQTALKSSTIYMTVRQNDIKEAVTKLLFKSDKDYGEFDVDNTVIAYVPSKSTYKNATQDQIPQVTIDENGIITAQEGSQMQLKDATYVFNINAYLVSGANLGNKTLKVQVKNGALKYKVSTKGSIHLNQREESGIDFTFKLDKNHAKPLNAFLDNNSIFTIVRQEDSKAFRTLYDGSVVVRVRAKTVEELTAMYAQTGGNNMDLEKAREQALQAFKKKNNPVEITVIMENGDALMSGKKMISVKQDSIKGRVTGQATLYEGVNNSKSTVKVELTSPKDKTTGEVKYKLDHVTSQLTAEQAKVFGYDLYVDENGIGYLTISLKNTGILKANKTYKLKFLLQGEDNSGDGGTTVTVSVKLKK